MFVLANTRALDQPVDRYDEASQIIETTKLSNVRFRAAPTVSGDISDAG